MEYRDERDALRGRVENLEQQLGEAQRALDVQHGDDRRARIAQLEEQLGEAQHLLGRLQAELAALKGPQPARRSAAPVVVGAALMTMMAGGAAAFILMARISPPVPVTAPVPIGDLPASPVPAPHDPAPLQPEAPSPSPAPAPAPEPASVHATWTARITRSTGSAPPAGAACTLEATLAGVEVKVSDLTITCGGRELYRSKDALNGTSMLSWGASERVGKAAGTLVYEVLYEDKGARSGTRNEVSLDTSKGVGAVWRTSVPAFQVDLSITRQSAPVKGAPLAR